MCNGFDISFLVRSLKMLGVEGGGGQWSWRPALLGVFLQEGSMRNDYLRNIKIWTRFRHDELPVVQLIKGYWM
jgi:hypothetical protein